MEVAGVFVGRGLGVGDDWEGGLVFLPVYEAGSLEGLDEGSQWNVLSSSLRMSFLEAIFDGLVGDHVLIDGVYSFSSG